jgi:lipopolysaccharide transport system ATP-binding protein
MKGLFKVSSVEETWKLAKQFAATLVPGDVVCLEGDLGAGKTTFINMISGITTPDNGKIKVKGKVASELGFVRGFDWELSGRENIFIKSCMNGWKKKEIKRNGRSKDPHP